MYNIKGMMKKDIKDRIKEIEKNKTQQLSITLSGSSIINLKEEMKRLNIKSRSFMIEMVLNHYFDTPITQNMFNKKQEDNEKKS